MARKWLKEVFILQHHAPICHDAKNKFCFYTLCWSLLLLLRLQPIIDDNMSNICWVVNVHFQFVLSGLKKPWLKEKMCCHWTLWSCCPCCEQIFSLLQHIGTYSPCFDFFLFFFFSCCVFFFTDLPTLLILCYSLIDFFVSLPALSEHSLQISLNIKILLKKSLFTIRNWISYTTEYVCTWL